jgi:F-box-like
MTTGSVRHMSEQPFSPNSPHCLPTPVPDLEQPTHPAEPEEHGTFPFRFSDLPLEIFQQILLCCATPSEYRASHPHQKASPEWLPITQVCHSWRTITHTCPLLWTMITPNLNLFWVDIMQERSRPLLLDVHLRVGRLDIGDRQVIMTAYNAQLILLNVSHRMRSLRLDGPRDHVRSTLSNLLCTSSPILSLSFNLPPWDRGARFNIPETIFASNPSVRSLSFSAERALRAPDWLLQGLTSFKIGGKIPLLELLDALRQMPVLEYFTFLGCTAVWDENDVVPGDPIPMNRLKEFTVRTESPRHFVLLATNLAIPDAARKRLSVRTLAAPGYDLLTHWLQALPSLYASYTRGGLQNVRISGGPTRGRFLAWTDEPHDDTARFCFDLKWNMHAHAPDQVRANESTSPFYYLGALCDALNAVGVRRVLVEGDPAHIAVAAGFWHQFFAQLPSVQELWLYPGTAEVIRSACTPPDAERVLQSLKRIYVVEGRLSAEPPKLFKPNITSESDHSGALSGVDLNGSPSPPSDGLFIESGENRREELHNLDVRPGLMALLRGGTAPSREVHLRNCEVEDGALGPLCALAKVLYG